MLTTDPRRLNPDGRPLPNGAFVELGAMGQFNGQTMSLGTLHIEDVGEVHQFRSDFENIGSPTTRVEVFRRGQRVAVFDDLPNGPIATVPEGMWCVGGGKIIPGPNPDGPPCFITDFPMDTPIDILRGTVVGDELRVLAAKPGGVVSSLDEFSVQARLVPELVVVGENTTRLGCPADFDNSGTVNSDDYFAFLAAFFAGDPRADFDDNGVINSNDYFAFLEAFFAACP